MLIKKKELKERLKELESQNKSLKFQVNTLNQIAEFYSSIREDHDQGKFAQQVIKDMKVRLKKKHYKPVNYQMARIFSKTNQTYPIYVEGLFPYEEDDTD